MYKIILDLFTQKPCSVVLTPGNLFIPFASSNIDYQRFVYQINHDEAELEDSTGALMTPEEAKAFVATLPPVPNANFL